MLSCTNCTGEPQVPVTVTPFAHAGKTVTKCCGEPSVVCRENRCNNTCQITVRQKISITMPIHYEVDVSMWDSDINCYGNMNCCR